MSQVSASSLDNGGASKASLFLARQERLAALLAQDGLVALALNPGPSLSYLTGLSFHLMERPVVAIFFPHNQPVVVLPELESAKVERLPYPVRIFPYGEDPATWPSVFRKAAQAADLNGRQVGVEPTRLRVLELHLLEGAAPAETAGALATPARLTLDTTFTLGSRRIVLVTYDEEREQLVVRGGSGGS